MLALFAPTPSNSTNNRARFHACSPFKKRTTKSPSHEHQLSTEIDELMSINVRDSEYKRVMVVIDSYIDAKGALEWALSHTVQSQDIIILFHAARKDAKNHGRFDRRVHNLLHSMKRMCDLKRPEVHVEMATRGGREKGPTIVEAAKQMKASLLILGHHKQSFVLRQLRNVWANNRNRQRVVDYCIQNASCTALAVRRKNRRCGGYSITTKFHKNFWLLA